ncbi:UBX domain-containing protein 4 [Drosophila biarmipes]|uniref:UBX domain-containing protein 4 n=1 Tax=Drosophila biarmipes TaxID=125945 RepID=UPI0007E84843|nr:UBX domain-containing protein 4 [Drosophila biarmipes]
MNWHTGNIAEAVAESKAKDAVFVVFIEGQDEMSRKLERFVDDSRVRSRLETSDFVAIKVQGNSSAYGQFMSLYKVVPVPSLFFIGKSGTPLEIATGITASVDELSEKIDKVLILAGKRTETEVAASTSSIAGALEPNSVRSFAGADDSGSLSNAESVQAPEKFEAPETASVSNLPTEEVDERKSNPPNSPAASSYSSIPAELSSSSLDGNADVSPAAVAAEKRAAATKVEASASTSTAARNFATANLIPAVPLLTPAVPASIQLPAEGPGITPAVPAEGPGITESEERMAEVRNLLEQKRRERVEEEKRLEKENELRRRREGREAQTQQAKAKEQELRNMQEQIRRERQEEQLARERIRAQIAADRAEQAQRFNSSDLNSSTNSVAPTAASNAITTESSVSSVDETRLQIRLPGGIQRTKSFPAGEVLATVRVYVRNELLAASDVRDFTLATSYPRREFQTEDEVKTLSELNLVPNAVVLVLTKDQVNRVVRSGGSLMTMLATFIWAMITPAAKAFDYIHKMGLRPLTQKLTVLMANIRWPGQQGNVEIHQGDAAARRNMDMFSLRPTPAPGYEYDEPSTSTARPTTTPGSGATDRPTPQTQPGSGSTPPAHNVGQSQASGSQSQQFQQRPGGYQPPKYGDANIRRLQDTKKDENDKDKATYNGNSTQQQ